MSGNPVYSPVVTPSTTIALTALGPTARGASVSFYLGGFEGNYSIDVVCDQLPPGQQLGSLGSIYVDNSENDGTTIQVIFDDTGCVYSIPAGEASWILAVTNRLRFRVVGPSPAELATVTLQILNVVPPTDGVKLVSGTVSVVPPAASLTSFSKNFPAAASTQLIGTSSTIDFLMFAMPQTSDGWFTLNGTAAAPNGADSFYLGAGQYFILPSNLGLTNSTVYLNVTTGGMVPAVAHER